MSEAALKIERKFSWGDYRQWSDSERWEIIDGTAYDMSPSPAFRHQTIVGEIYAAMLAHFRGRKCRVLLSPMDVKLSAFNVVQPDLLVVCDPAQVKPTHIEGAPTLVIEVLSPSSEEHDRATKTALYARFGVKEYWVVTPFPSLIEVFVLDGDSYRLRGAFTKTDALTSPTFPDLKIKLSDVFNFPLEPGEEPRQVREPPPRYTAAPAPQSGE
jgi:Uma2 family endonuclease